MSNVSCFIFKFLLNVGLICRVSRKRIAVVRGLGCLARPGQCRRRARGRALREDGQRVAQLRGGLWQPGRFREPHYLVVWIGLGLVWIRLVLFEGRWETIPEGHQNHQSKPNKGEAETLYFCLGRITCSLVSQLMNIWFFCSDCGTDRPWGGC